MKPSNLTEFTETITSVKYEAETKCSAPVESCCIVNAVQKSNGEEYNQFIRTIKTVTSQQDQDDHGPSSKGRDWNLDLRNENFVDNFLRKVEDLETQLAHLRGEMCPEMDQMLPERYSILSLRKRLDALKNMGPEVMDEIVELRDSGKPRDHSDSDISELAQSVQRRIEALEALLGFSSTQELRYEFSMLRLGNLTDVLEVLNSKATFLDTEVGKDLGIMLTGILADIKAAEMDPFRKLWTKHLPQIDEIYKYCMQLLALQDCIPIMRSRLKAVKRVCQVYETTSETLHQISRALDSICTRLENCQP